MSKVEITIEITSIKLNEAITFFMFNLSFDKSTFFLDKIIILKWQ